MEAAKRRIISSNSPISLTHQFRRVVHGPITLDPTRPDPPHFGPDPFYCLKIRPNLTRPISSNDEIIPSTKILGAKTATIGGFLHTHLATFIACTQVIHLTCTVRVLIRFNWLSIVSKTE
jgi:hypothetical protein